MYLPPSPLTFAQNLSFNSYFEVERNHIISYPPVIRFLFLSLSFSDQRRIHCRRIPDQVGDNTEYYLQLLFIFRYHFRTVVLHRQNSVKENH